MKTKNLERLAEVISDAVANNQDGVWVWLATVFPRGGYVIDRDYLEEVVRDAIENF